MLDSSSPWTGLPLGTDGLSAKYCEQNRLDWVLRQPINTLSNAAFAVAGVLVLLEHGKGGRLDGLPRILFGLSLCALALGSAAFHASITLAAQKADMGATYAVVLALIVFSLSVCKPPVSIRSCAIGVLALDAIFVYLDLFLQGAWLLPVLLAMALGAATWVNVNATGRHERRHFQHAVGAMAFAAVAWILDDQKFFCAPSGLFQWHSLWHIAAADSALELFRFLDRVPAGPQVAGLAGRELLDA